MKTIPWIKSRLKQIAAEQAVLQTKIDVYSSTDQLAMAVHQTKWMALEPECLELMTELGELERDLPPPHEHLGV